MDSELVIMRGMVIDMDEAKLQTAALDKTRPTTVSIGQCHAPQPYSLPGFIRINSAHQDDQYGNERGLSLKAAHHNSHPIE